ncbi:MAG: phosphatase PAP2 family protein [Nocardioides sp.]|nr:phosphatase PAP2 family protein [Nocardioides sp.]
MTVETSEPPAGTLHTRTVRPPTGPRGASLLARATSIPALVLGLAVVTLAAAGPMQLLDQRLHRRWIVDLAPGLEPFVQGVLDRIAGQAVGLPVLAVVAIVLAHRRGSWRPIWFAVMAEVAFFFGVGALKLLLARPAPVVGETHFLAGGLLEFGERGISYPSGHAAEAVLVYGAAVHLIARYSGASPRLVGVLSWAVAAITVNSVVVSFALGWHWATDLIGGVLAGGLFLRLLILGDHRDWGPPPSTDGIEMARAQGQGPASRAAQLRLLDFH